MFWTGLSMGALAVAELVALLVLARLLSPNEFGLYAAALVVIKFSSIFEGLGVAPAIVQRHELEERHLRVGFTLSLVLSLTVAALVWTVAPVIADLLRLPGLTPVVRASCVVFLCQGVAMVAQASAQRALRFRWLAAVDAAAFAIGYVVAAPVLAWLGFGIWALIGALVIQNLVRMVVLVLGQPHAKRPMLERPAIGELLYFGGGFTLARIFNYLATQIDRLVAGRWLGADTLGAYSLASQLMTAPAMLVGQILDRVLFPTMALIQQEPARLARAYRSAIAACALFALPTSAIVVIVAPELVRVMLGPAWEGVVIPLQILASGMLFRTSYKLSDSLVRATGAVYARAWRQAIFAVAVAVGATTGQRWGVAGMSLGVVAAVALNFFLMAQLSLRVTGMSWTEFAVAHLPGLALAVAVATPVWAMTEQLRRAEVGPFTLLIEVALVGATAGLVLCWLLPSLFLGREGRSVLRMLAAMTPAFLQRSRPG
ncbi:polysaccharide biosynthesis protein [Sinorhizobium saheli]|uniref:Polysaccharide biosynthesis protein n=1 Tax=Sinorhizobium saheli TaxID=36856 RepID=A0A178Y4F8_SINSA|nr:polysaccharide biosynthesis protein [Sinorhizobium saheli]